MEGYQEIISKKLFKKFIDSENFFLSIKWRGVSSLSKTLYILPSYTIFCIRLKFFDCIGVDDVILKILTNGNQNPLSYRLGVGFDEEGNVFCAYSVDEKETRERPFFIINSEVIPRIKEIYNLYRSKVSSEINKIKSKKIKESESKIKDFCDDSLSCKNDLFVLLLLLVLSLILLICLIWLKYWKKKKKETCKQVNNIKSFLKKFYELK